MHLKVVNPFNLTRNFNLLQLNNLIFYYLHNIEKYKKKMMGVNRFCFLFLKNKVY